MEFLLVGESKIKIVLSEEERVGFNLNANAPDVSGPSARRSFWNILDMAKKEVGFDPAGDKVLIQLYPMSHGGCEIFVTKLGVLPETSAKIVSKSNKVAMLSKKKSLYAFSSLDDITNATRAIKAISGDVTVKSDVYFQNDKYYLSIEEYGKGGEPMEFPCVLEFATELTADMFTYILEHCHLLTDGDGIEIFSML